MIGNKNLQIFHFLRKTRAKFVFVGLIFLFAGVKSLIENDGGSDTICYRFRR